MPNEDKRIECEIEDGKLLICASLEDKVQLANEHKKGLVCVVIFNMKTGNDKFIGVAYKEDANDNGVMLNYCPWCGKNILNCDAIE